MTFSPIVTELVTETLSAVPSPTESTLRERLLFARSTSEVRTGYLFEATALIFTSEYFVGTDLGSQFSAEFHSVADVEEVESAPVQTYSCPAKNQFVFPVPSVLNPSFA